MWQCVLLILLVWPEYGTAWQGRVFRGERWTPNDSLVTSRRAFGFTSLAVILSVPQVSTAATDNRLFESNSLLTNRVLEQIRIWEQEEANQLQYGGELARGDAGNQGKVSAYPSLLVPILELDQQLQEMQRALVKRENYATVLALLQQPQYETVALKRAFNDFADNIYYSDPDRANLYLGGGGKYCCCSLALFLTRYCQN
jgi:hypothetical protein